MTVQIYAAREDEPEESEPYGGSQYSSEGEEAGFENKSQEEEKVWMHMYRTEEFKEDFKEIEELDKEDRLMEENSDDEGIVEDSRGDSEDREDDDPIQEFPTEESEMEGTEEWSHLSPSFSACIHVSLESFLVSFLFPLPTFLVGSYIFLEHSLFSMLISQLSWYT